jgi:serine/threonine protein phosphatase PrpC
MSKAADTDDPIEPIVWPAEFDNLIRGSQQWLAERGEVVVGSGCFQSDGLSGSVHTDFGPEDQDKDANQDYAVVWLPRDEEIRKRFRLALALGDGLTTSFRSEWASALVCSLALRALAEGDPALPPQDLARFACNQAGQSLGRLGDEWAREPEASCPVGQFVSTWKYILRKGVLFQSTLTLAWLDRRSLHVAMVGDGGGVWRSYRPSPDGKQANDHVLAQCDLDRHQVCALGPADRSVREFDCWRRQELNGPFLCALHTDGVGRGLGDNPIVLLEELEKLQTAGEQNTARRFIDHAIEERPRSFDDNLTLAIIKGE